MKISETLTPEQLAAFAKRFLAEAIDSRGFGVPSKAELEAVVFDELIKTEILADKSNYELASLFRIPESRVKALLLTVGLRHSRYDHKACVKEVFERCLAYDTLQNLDDRVQLAVENPAKRREIEHALKQCGETPEYGRNREILIFTSRTLLMLLGAYLGDKEDRFIKWLKGKIKDDEAVSKLQERAVPLQKRILRALEKVGGKTLAGAVLEEGAKLAFGVIANRGTDS